MEPFRPEDHGLDSSFRLTRFTKLKGWGCKVPQAELLTFLEGLDREAGGGLGIGLDSCVLPTRHKGVSLVQTTDFFYPLVEDPYMQGKIACANVLSDLYAMGVSECDNMLMLLGVSIDLTHQERHIVTPLMIKGFSDLAKEAGCSVNGGQTVLNPWFIVGGVASSVCSDDEFIMPNQACVGDVLVLTKALGTQIAVNVHQWLDEPKNWTKVEKVISRDQAESAYTVAMKSMARLNRTGARLMRKYNAHAATDVTGFGIKGHATNLAEFQKASVSFNLHTLPIIANMATCAQACAESGLNFKLCEGFSAETSGGLLVAMPHDQAAAFCAEIESIDGCPAWIIGDVIEGDKTANIAESPKIIEAW